LDLRPAPGAGLALVAVHLERHRGLVGDRVADHSLVVLEGAAEDLAHRLVQPLDVLVLEVVALAERRQLRGPQDLVHPGAADTRSSNSWSRPADIRCTSSESSPKWTTGILPTRRTPVTVRPARESSGGWTVFIVTIPGANADSTSTPPMARSRRRATISTSGS